MSDDAAVRARFEETAKNDAFLKHCSFRRLSDGEYYEVAVIGAYRGFKLAFEDLQMQALAAESVQ